MASPSGDEPLGRGRQELAAARLLADAGFGLQAISRAYYAAFFAAEAALTALGEVRAKHSGVIAAFGRLVVYEGGLDEAAGRGLRALFDRRSLADQALAPEVPPGEVAASVADAERLVDAVAAWLAVPRG